MGSDSLWNPSTGVPAGTFSGTKVGRGVTFVTWLYGDFPAVFVSHDKQGIGH